MVTQRLHAVQAALEDALVDTRERVSVVGTGFFGRALANRLHRASVAVVLGSRDPERYVDGRRAFEVNVPVMGIESALAHSGIIVLAIPATAHHRFSDQFATLLAGKILIDVSNPPLPPPPPLCRRRCCEWARGASVAGGGSAVKDESASKDESTAMRLARLVGPRVHVLKGFNTISAYALSGSQQMSTPVLMCGDSEEAKRRVDETLVRPLGYRTVDIGGLSAAADLEAIPHRLFPRSITAGKEA